MVAAEVGHQIRGKELAVVAVRGVVVQGMVITLAERATLPAHHRPKEITVGQV